MKRNDVLQRNEGSDLISFNPALNATVRCFVAGEETSVHSFDLPPSQASLLLWAGWSSGKSALEPCSCPHSHGLVPQYFHPQIPGVRQFRQKEVT